VTSSAFRQHHQVPVRVESALFRQLIGEWVSLNALASSAAAILKWGRLEPALAGYHSPGDLVDAVDAANPAGKDEILGALIRLFQAGHQLAGRVVLQSMLIKLGRITLRTRGTSSDNAWAEDRRHVAVAEFWDILASYPLQRRPQKIAANLGLDTLHRLTGETRGQGPDRPLDPTELPEEESGRLMTTTFANPEEVGLSVDADLVQVVTWAVRRGVITAADAELLVQVYLPTPGTSGTAAAATRLGLSDVAVRQRCSRARKLLIVAVRDEFQTPATGVAQSA